MAKQQSTKRGAVSIFIVLFAALLLTILTVGFITLMLSEQNKAINNNLSQSAHDSALAGVEDAKRVLRACSTGNSEACAALAANDDCKVIARSGVVGSTVADKETVIQSTSANGQEFNQAYTCVNINMETPDFLYESSEGQSLLVPLKAKGDVSRVVVEWFMQRDIGVGVSPTIVSGTTLPEKSSWGATTPPLMRAQIITPGQSFDLGSLNTSNASQTAFLRPSSLAGNTTNLVVDMNPDARPRAVDSATEYNNSVTPLSCSSSFANDAYSCRVELNLGRIISAADSQNAYIRLTTIYRGSSVRVSMKSADNQPVYFDGAQPSVDSTGRASNLFRRVEARLQIGDDFPYPNYAADVVNDICKDFSVDTVKAYGSATCTP